ncbi:hypothetical protein JCGZ_02477 [Jatropha curcas]|uniref:Uncharacterized protein n=1 Tax=Jatropha curcas TaxID=180498 RepID=A0A067JPX9_JATCU|nr:hypothetical protein JCGZ_02477 [Jatropha curcas]
MGITTIVVAMGGVRAEEMESRGRGRTLAREKAAKNPNGDHFNNLQDDNTDFLCSANKDEGPTWVRSGRNQVLRNPKIGPRSVSTEAIEQFFDPQENFWSVKNNGPILSKPVSLAHKGQATQNVSSGSCRAAAEREHVLILGGKSNTVKTHLMVARDNMDIRLAGLVNPEPPNHFHDPSQPHPSTPNLDQEIVIGSSICDDELMVVEETPAQGTHKPHPSFVELVADALKNPPPERGAIN